MNLLITGAYKWSEEQKQQIKTLGYSIDFQQFENEHTFNPENMMPLFATIYLSIINRSNFVI